MILFRLGTFNIYIRPANIGVIIKVETNQYKIIDQNGAVRYIKPTEISQKRDSKNAVASDVDRHPLQAGDAVEIIAGEHQVTLD